MGAWVPTDKVETAYNKIGERIYRRVHVAPAHLREAWAAGYDLLLHPSHPAWVAEMEQVAEVCWSTMWVGSAASRFAPVAGFGHDWEYVDFPAYHRPSDWHARTGMGVGAYKLPGWKAVTTATEPIVIIDDDLEPVVYLWAAEREANGGPTLLIQPDPAVGMTRAHVDQVLDFARAHALTVPTAIGA